MTLRPSAPWWSERSRRTRHRLALTGNRPADRVAGSLRTAHSRDPPLPPNVIRAGQRPGAGPTPLARDTAARRPQHSRRGAGRGHPNAGRNEMETRDADGSWRAFKQRSRTTSCCPGTFLPHAVSSPGGWCWASRSGPGSSERGEPWRKFRYTLAHFVSRHCPQAAAARADLWTNIPPPTTSAPLHPDQPLERSRHTTHLTPPPNGAGPRPKNRGWGQIRPAR